MQLEELSLQQNQAHNVAVSRNHRSHQVTIRWHQSRRAFPHVGFILDIRDAKSSKLGHIAGVCERECKV